MSAGFTFVTRLKGFACSRIVSSPGGLKRSFFKPPELATTIAPLVHSTGKYYFRTRLFRLEKFRCVLQLSMGCIAALLLLLAHTSSADINNNVKEHDLLKAKATEVEQRKHESRVVITSGNAKTECLTVEQSGVIVTAQRTNTINPQEG